MTQLMFRVLVQKLTPRPKHQVWGYLLSMISKALGGKQVGRNTCRDDQYIAKHHDQLWLGIQFRKMFSVHTHTHTHTHTHKNNMVPCVGAGAWFTLTLDVWAPEGGFVCWLTQKETLIQSQNQREQGDRENLVILGEK